MRHVKHVLNGASIIFRVDIAPRVKISINQHLTCMFCSCTL